MTDARKVAHSPVLVIWKLFWSNLVRSARESLWVGKNVDDLVSSELDLVFAGKVVVIGVDVRLNARMVNQVVHDLLWRHIDDLSLPSVASRRA